MASQKADARKAAGKSAQAFRTISEVAEEVGVPQHVLRFWETRFTQLRPLKRNGGRRLYRPDHVLMLQGIRAFLYDDGMTIKGVQKILREQGVKYVIGRGETEVGLHAGSPPPGDAAERLAALRGRLEAVARAQRAAVDGPMEDAGESTMAGETGRDPDDDRTPELPGLEPADQAAAQEPLDPADRARVAASIARLEKVLNRLEEQG